MTKARVKKVFLRITCIIKSLLFFDSLLFLSNGAMTFFFTKYENFKVDFQAKRIAFFNLKKKKILFGIKTLSRLFLKLH